MIGRAFLFILILCVLNTFFVYSAEENINAKELKIKAAMLYQITRFISWPEVSFDASADFLICLSNANEYLDYLNPITTRSYKSHPIKVKQLRPGENAQNCHVLLTESESCDACLAKTSTTLTISSREKFIYQQGDIEFRNINNRIRLAINQRKIRRKGIKVSAKLLEIADEVVK